MRSGSQAFLLLSSIAAIGGAAIPPAASAQAHAAMERCASPQPTTQERLPFDRTALEAFVDRIFEVDGNDAPGAAVLVTREGRVIVQRQSGMASLEHGVPFTPNHVVRLPYSEGREFLAIAAAFMEIDGLTHLDHRVGGYFPRLPAWSEPVWRPARAWAAT